MATWQRKQAGRGRVALESTNVLHEAIIAHAMFLKGNLPAGFGVFAVNDYDSQNTIWYFSPEAEVLGQQFGAQPCEKPIAKDEFSLLGGNQSSGMLYFPEYFDRSRRR